MSTAVKSDGGGGGSQLQCQRCQTVLSEPYKFCSGCGAKVPEEQLHHSTRSTEQEAITASTSQHQPEILSNEHLKEHQLKISPDKPIQVQPKARTESASRQLHHDGAAADYKGAYKASMNPTANNLWSDTGSSVDVHESKVNIIFHVFIPSRIWGCNQNSQLCLALSHSGWDIAVGNVFAIRETKEFLEFECKIPIKSANLSDGIAYKYCVINCERKDQYEYLHGLPEVKHNQFRNRYLKLDQKGGDYHQYDSMAFPHISKQSSQWNLLKFWTNQKSSDEIDLPNQEAMQSGALKMYFERYEDCLCNLNFDSFNAPMVLNEMMYIFHSLLCVQSCTNNGTEPIQTAYNKLYKVMINYLIEITKCLASINIGIDALMNGRRILSSIVVICFFHNLIPSYVQPNEVPLKNISTLLSFFRLLPDTQNRKCEDWNYLNKCIPEEFKGTVSDALTKFVDHMKTRDHKPYLWLFAIPVVHFLKQLSYPFQEVEYDCKKIQWNKEFGGVTKFVTEISERMLEKLEPLAKMDPLFLYGLVYVCPSNDFHNLIPKVPAFLSIAFIVKDLEKRKKPEVQRILYLADSFENAMMNRMNHRSDRALLKASLNFVKEILKKIELNSEGQNLLKKVFSLFLRCIEFFDNLKADYIVEAVKEVRLALEEKMNLVYENPFETTSAWKNYYRTAELLVWNKIIQVSVKRENVLAIWHKEIISSIILPRIRRVNISRRIDLLVSLDSTPDCHSIITSAIIDAVMETIAANEKKGIENLISKGRRNVGKIFDKILEKRYANRIGRITFNELLTWDTWTTFLKIYSTKANHSKFSLSNNFMQMSSYANHELERVCESIQAGDITITRLSELKKNGARFDQLLNAVGKELTKIKTRLSQCFDEQKQFEERLKSLKQMLGHLKVPVEGLDQLSKDILSSDMKTKPINSLWQCSGGSFTLLYPAAAVPLNIVDVKFDVMLSSQFTLFPNFWKEHMDKATILLEEKKRDALTIAEIKSVLWDNTFAACRCLEDNLRNRKITLTEVNRHFKPISGDLLKQVQNLCAGIHKCESPDLPSDFKWIDEVVSHITDYWSLLLLSEEAEAILSLKTKLSLTGSFAIIEALKNQDLLLASDEPLSSITESMRDAGNFIKKIKTDPIKLQCLSVFIESSTIINWIKNEAPQGFDDLKNFVSVALHTVAGEGDLANDYLSRLANVGSGYCPLIYDLKADASFESFMECCLKVWDELKSNPSLIKNLIACSGDIEWYKKVKDNQASVEDTSYGQMNAIMEYGCYQIGIKQPTICKTQNDVISLRNVSEEEKEQPEFNLEDLQDLQSKLILITGRNADNKKIVDLFVNTFQWVRCIADLLIGLQQFGNVKYTGWILLVPCSRDESIIDKLQHQAKKMEQELFDWKKIVKLARSDFYELNYYTTVQLLALRRELSMYKGDSYDIPPSVLFLLQSISHRVDSRGVRQLVKSIVSPTTSNPFITKPILREDNLEQSKGKLVKAEDPLGDAPSHSDMPELKENELTSDRREILEFVTRTIDCSKFLVLKAFEQCQGKDMDKYDYQEWCLDNITEFDFDDANVSDSDEEETRIELVLSELEFETDQLILQDLHTGPQEAGDSLYDISSSFHDIETVESRLEEYVDINHPIVQDLISADYPKEQSILAVRKFGTLNAAMEYLDHGSEGDTENFSRENTARNDHSIEDDKMKRRCPKIYADSKAEERYLSLEQLGRVLKILSQRLPGEVQQQRSFAIQFLKPGSPNLLVVGPDLVLKTTLSLYMEDHFLPLPTAEEVLVCNSNTTAEEIELFWMRTIADPDFKRIFCLIHAEKLTYQVSDQALQSLSLCKGIQGYRLVIICSNEEEEKSHLISKLYHFRRPYTPRIELKDYKAYLSRHFIGGAKNEADSCMAAFRVDFEQSCVRFVSSNRSGMGKSLYIKHLAEKHAGLLHVIIPIHGPVVTPDSVLELFIEHARNDTCCLYHIDIAPNVLWQVDTILFSLLILRGICDSQGRVWRCHPNQLYAIEVTLPKETAAQDMTVPESRTTSLMKLMPSVYCPSPEIAFDYLEAEKFSNFRVLMDDKEFRSDSYQRVYQFIRRYRAGKNIDEFGFQDTIEGSTEDCLEMLLEYCGVSDPSWSEIRHFVKFLDLQLKSCQESVYTRPEIVKDVLSGLKGFVVKFMIRMSRDFSTSSLYGEVDKKKADAGDDITKYQISKTKKWEFSIHPYIFFNKDRESITFVGFTVSDQGDLINPNDTTEDKVSIMTPKLYTGLKQNKVNFNDDSRLWTKPTMINNISKVMGVSYRHDPDESYVLTYDNVIKILAIQMRFRCGIPVVIMGETGCGKTRLIRYMCDLARQGKPRNNMLILKVHGGISEDEVCKFIEAAEKQSEENSEDGLDTVVFFDEANTTDAIGLIKEVMCDRRINGKPVSDDLKFIAACNPYRKHSDLMISRLESAGLGFFVQASETQHKLGKIPLRQLVYRVLDLPPSMRPLVYDFGQLNADTEGDYIKQIVYDHIRHHDKLCEQLEELPEPISNVLCCSQKYMRDREDECSFVSLRDVERAMIVFEYLYGMMDIFGPLMDEYATGKKELVDSKEVKLKDHYESPGPVARALILSLNVCYDARLLNRDEYEKGVVEHFTGPIELSDGDVQFRNEIRWCQDVLLDNMVLGDNIARNTALRENVFMMTVCLELKIPLFLVGKPGSSKSLAKSIVTDSLRGKYSRNNLLKNFKEVQIFSYQCSQLSTPEGVIEVFSNASKFQANRDKESCVAVVVLDEVGLAEDSPGLPLKALHPLLEDGTEGAKKDFTDEIISRQERVGFIGISNWALDPAKMNRGVMVTRADPNEEELVFSAKGICSNKENDPIRKKLEDFFRPFAKAYKIICIKQKREFFGLRDFYSLIKMLYSMCQESNDDLTLPQLIHAIKRNFGGLETEYLNPFKEFREVVPKFRKFDARSLSAEMRPIVYPDYSIVGLIKISLSPKRKTWHGENRYVLFLTENYAALDVLKNPTNYLDEELSISQRQDGAAASEPFILFGSSFPKDKEYTQVCRNINQIKICMETGRTVILLNLENLYESLYDVLNQYYIERHGTKYVDLGLQTHRVKCRVHDNFRLVLIAERDTVYDKFPTPLINRLEKHFVLTSSVLSTWQKVILNNIKKWVQDFCNLGGFKFRQTDAFIGFQKDTPASIVFHASKLFQLATTAVSTGESVEGDKWYQILQWCKVEPNSEEKKSTKMNAVFRLSKFLLLQTATPDAVVRLERTDLFDELDEVKKIYFEQQQHESLAHFLNHHVHGSRREGLNMQITTSCHLLSQIELRDLECKVNVKVASFYLHEFDTELDFTNKVGSMFKCEDKDQLVIIQCESGHLHGNLIACARYRISDLRAEEQQITHVLFIIHLPQQVTISSFVGFQGEPWISAHIDDLRLPSDTVMSTKEAIGLTISELFLGELNPHAISVLEKCISHFSKGESHIVEDTMSESDDDEFFDAQEWHDSTPLVESAESTDEEFQDSLVAPEPTAELIIQEDDKKEDIPIASSIPASLSSSLHIKSLSPPRRSPLFKRLRNCIQAAASRLKDSSTKRSTKRVEILINLIPKELPDIPDTTQFHGILIVHIYKALQKRDLTMEDGKNWVIKEAMDSRSLQHGGTFRNALSKRVDDVIAPIFSEVIASIDQNYNLDLIDSESINVPLTQFWLSMFRECGFMQFSDADMIAPREQVPGVGGRKSLDDYKCELPFSWIIHDAVDSQWSNALSTSGDGRHDLHKQLCAAVDPTVVGGVLKSVSNEDSELFYRRYLHDFVRIVHRCTHSKKENESKEYELLSNALDALVYGSKHFNVEGSVSLIEWIAALHIVYEKNKSQVLWFGQLVALSPEVMVYLHKDNVCHGDEMILHFCAVEQALINLAPPLNKDDPANSLIPWLNEVHVAQNAINAIISLPSKSDIKVESRLKWGMIRCLQLFLEHVLIGNPFYQSVAYLKRLELTLKKKRNFLESQTLKAVKNHLKVMIKGVKNKKYLKDKEFANFQRDCHNFFMEVVSTLCFGSHAAPESSLIEDLMEMVFTEDSDLVSPITEAGGSKSDTVSVMKSSMLQLLLEHNSDHTKVHLEEFFTKSQKAFGGKFDESLYLLCIQCFEDALCKQQAVASAASRLRKTVDKLKSSCQVLRKSDPSSAITINYLEAIARIRFVITEIAGFLNSNSFATEQRLLQQVNDICVDRAINTVDFSEDSGDVTGPTMYLLKVLVRQYGFHTLNKIFAKNPWIVPKGLCEPQSGEIMDQFVVYNRFCNYSVLRDILIEALYNGKIGELSKITLDFDLKSAAVFMLAVYKAVTMGFCNPKRPSDVNMPKLLHQVIANMENFTPLMQQAAKLLFANKQGGPLAELTVSADNPVEYHVLGSIVVHTIAALSANPESPILRPFVHMLTNPAALANSLFPTMKDEVRKIAHDSSDDEVCGESSSITTSAPSATEEHGYTLDKPGSRVEAPLVDQRSLSPSAICIVRALMHSTLLWCSCHAQDLVVAELASLIKTPISPNDLPQFFWEHLRKDIEHLRVVTQKDLEETATIVHLVLHGILTKAQPAFLKSCLNDTDARNEWEMEFSKHFIEPVIHRDVDAQIKTIKTLVSKDYQQGYHKLLSLAYEKDQVSEGNIQPHLWSYRQRITLEHLRETLSESSLKIKYPILHEFLQQERSLRATQYLPDIMKLQRGLFDTFHLRSDRRKDDEKKTIGQFLRSFDNTRKYGEKFESLVTAWGLVGKNLKDYVLSDKVLLDEKYWVPAITKELPLEYLIPTTTGAGALTVCLVDCLIHAHNSFIDKCSSQVHEKIKSSWDRQKIPLAHIHRCHLLDYEHHIVPVVLSHCCYSLRVGEAHTVQYDYEALEKHILDKFIHGKPRILPDDSQVVCKDNYTSVILEAVRKKISPQVRLEPRVQKEILSDLRESDRLRENLDVVNIVIGFLSSGGGKPDKLLGDYIDRVLQMKGKLSSQKIRRYCELQHIVSLWETLSVELAKLAHENDQEPFDLGDLKCLELSKDQQSALDKWMKKLDLDRLLGALFEFIDVYIKNSPQRELDEHSLKDTILKDQFDHLDMKAPFSEFPKPITLSQTVAVWKHIVKYQRNLKKTIA